MAFVCKSTSYKAYWYFYFYFFFLFTSKNLILISDKKAIQGIIRKI